MSEPPRQPVDLRGNRALVLGATGFIGRWVAAAAAEAGAELHVGVRDVDAWKRIARRHGVEAVIHQVDLATDGAVETLLARARPEICFNLAAHGVDRRERDEKLAWCINSELVERLALMMPVSQPGAWKGARIVQLGSAQEYGPSKNELAEDGEASPDTLYGETKLDGTRRLAAVSIERGLASITARLFTVYGPGEETLPSRLLPTLLTASRTNSPVELSAGNQSRDFGHVEEVASMLLRLSLRGEERGAVVNLASGSPLTVREFVLRAARVLGIEEDRLRFGALSPRAEEPDHPTVAVRRLEMLTGRKLGRSVEEGVRRTRDFLRGVQDV